MKRTAPRTRRLEDLVSVGLAIRRDLNVLGVRTVAQLAGRDPRVLYDRLCRQTGRRQDPCVLDTFRAAIAQAQDPDLPVEYAVWWFWTRVRKGAVPAPQAAQSQRSATSGSTRRARLAGHSAASPTANRNTTIALT
jgi:hypothetical protein